MSDAATNGEAVAVEDMSRDELEAEVSELRERIDAIEDRLDEKASADRAVTRSSVNLLLDALLGGEVDDFDADPASNRDLVEDLGRRIRDVEQTTAKQQDVVRKLSDGKTSGPDEAFARIVDTARRLSNSSNHVLPNNRVWLGCEEIAQATGLGERQASNYIDRFGEERVGADWRSYQPPSEQNGGEARKKKLIIDLDVWGEEQ